MSPLSSTVNTGKGAFLIVIMVQFSTVKILESKDIKCPSPLLSTLISIEALLGTTNGLILRLWGAIGFRTIPFVLGTVAGIIGTIQANEILKKILNIGKKNNI